MTGENESARVATSRVLIDALIEGRDTCADRARADAVGMGAVRRKLAQLIERETASQVEERAAQLAQQRLDALKAEHQLA